MMTTVERLTSIITRELYKAAKDNGCQHVKDFDGYVIDKWTENQSPLLLDPREETWMLIVGASGLFCFNENTKESVDCGYSSRLFDAIQKVNLDSLAVKHLKAYRQTMLDIEDFLISYTEG